MFNEERLEWPTYTFLLAIMVTGTLADIHIHLSFIHNLVSK